MRRSVCILSTSLELFQSNSDMRGSRALHIQGAIPSKTDTANFAFYQLYDELVAARRFTVRLPLKDFAEFRLVTSLRRIAITCVPFQMRQIENENLAKFMGLCINGPQYLSVWRYYTRGSIEDIIAKGSYAIDAAFVISLFRDIVNVGTKNLGDYFV